MIVGVAFQFMYPTIPASYIRSTTIDQYVMPLKVDIADESHTQE